jgi:hypothetical protein
MVILLYIQKAGSKLLLYATALLCEAIDRYIAMLSIVIDPPGVSQFCDSAHARRPPAQKFTIQARTTASGARSRVQKDPAAMAGGGAGSAPIVDAPHGPQPPPPVDYSAPGQPFWEPTALSLSESGPAGPLLSAEQVAAFTSDGVLDQGETYRGSRALT